MPGLFLPCSRPWLLTTAAGGDLEPAPVSRFRGACPHRYCSYEHWALRPFALVAHGEWPRGISPRGSLRTGLEPLDSSGSHLEPSPCAEDNAVYGLAFSIKLLPLLVDSLNQAPQFHPFAPRALPRFIATTSESAPVHRFRTLALMVLAIWTSPLTSVLQVPTFRTTASNKFRPPECRMSLRP